MGQLACKVTSLGYCQVCIVKCLQLIVSHSKVDVRFEHKQKKGSTHPVNIPCPTSHTSAPATYVRYRYMVKCPMEKDTVKIAFVLRIFIYLLARALNRHGIPWDRVCTFTYISGDVINSLR